MVAWRQLFVLEYSCIILTVLNFIITVCHCRDPCHNVEKISETWRDVTTHKGSQKSFCDKRTFHPARWYSFDIENELAIIPTTCVQNRKCGTTIAMHIDLDGKSMPGEGEKIAAYLCGSFNILGKYDCCVLRTPVSIVKCKGGRYVYRFHSSIDRCPVAVCTQKINDVIPTNVIAKRGDIHPGLSGGTGTTTLSPSTSDNTNAVNVEENTFNAAMVLEDEAPIDLLNNTAHVANNGSQNSTLLATSSIDTSSQNDSSTDVIGGRITTTASVLSKAGSRGNASSSNATGIDHVDTSVTNDTGVTDVISSTLDPNQQTPSSSVNQTQSTSSSTTTTADKGNVSPVTTQTVTNKDDTLPTVSGATATTLSYSSSPSPFETSSLSTPPSASLSTAASSQTSGLSSASSPSSPSSSSLPQTSEAPRTSMPPMIPNIITDIPKLHEVSMIEMIRLVFVGAYRGGGFSVDLKAILNAFLDDQVTWMKARDASLDLWFEIGQNSPVVESTNQTTYVDIAITHGWPQETLPLLQQEEFKSFVFEFGAGNLTLLAACRPCWKCFSGTGFIDDNNGNYNNNENTNNNNNTLVSPSRQTSSSTYAKNMPVLIAVTTICVFCLVVMAVGVICAKCRKRRSWDAGKKLQQSTLSDNRPRHSLGTPSPFTDTQIMQDEEAQDGSATGSAVDGGDTTQENSWVVPFGVELDKVNKETVAKTTEDTKF